MSNVDTDSMRDPGTPDDVVVTATAREPVTDPTLGIAVAAAERKQPFRPTAWSPSGTR